jgi:DNA-binding NarL/FixJ family response regulator
MSPLPSTILLVDDEAEFLDLARALLAADPSLAVVGTAGSAEEALARLPALDPDVAILDVQMPGAGGFAASRRLRAASPRLRTILVSAFGHSRYAALAREAGAAGFIAKRDLSAAAVRAALCAH